MTRLDAALVDRLVDADYLAASAAAERYVRVLAARVLAGIGCRAAGSAHGDVEAVAAACDVVPSALPALAWLLAAVTGPVPSAEPHGSPRGSSPDDADALHAAAALDAHASMIGCSRAMLDYVAERYADVLRGRRSGASVLLKGDGLAHWDRYFSALNPLYDIHNRLAAAGLAHVWPETRAPRILELGCGTGGGTVALVDALDGLPNGSSADLTVSDISPSFVVRVAERVSRPAGRMRTARVDFTRPLETQGIADHSADVIVATNALHGAPDLSATLLLLRPALASSGALVISESLCPATGSVHQDFIFNLLGSTGSAATRPTRFLTAARWRALLASSGWQADVAANTRGPELAMLAVAR